MCRTLHKHYTRVCCERAPIPGTGTVGRGPTVLSQIKLSRPIWDRPGTRTSFPGFLNTPNRFYRYALRFP